MPEQKKLTLEDIENLEREKQATALSSSREQLKKVFGNLPKKPKGDNKYHLPVLHINSPECWPSKPNEERIHYTDKVARTVCLSNCCGVEGLGAACCTIDREDFEHILGPVEEEWIKSFLKWANRKGLDLTRSDVIIDYEEGKVIGKTLFGEVDSDKVKVFQDEGSYPMLRFQVLGPRFACKFLSPNSKLCSIYEQRPPMCQNYLCEYVKSNFLIRTPQKPNTYVKLR